MTHLTLLDVYPTNEILGMKGNILPVSSACEAKVPTFRNETLRLGEAFICHTNLISELLGLLHYGAGSPVSVPPVPGYVETSGPTGTKK